MHQVGYALEAILECSQTMRRDLIKLDKDWIPEGDGYSLYIRPTGISTHVRNEATHLMFVRY